MRAKFGLLILTVILSSGSAEAGVVKGKSFSATLNRPLVGALKALGLHTERAAAPAAGLDQTVSAVSAGHEAPVVDSEQAGASYMLDLLGETLGAAEKKGGEQAVTGVSGEAFDGSKSETAEGNQIAALNHVAAQALKSVNNRLTQAEISFTNAVVSELEPLAVEVGAAYSKKGPEDDLELVKTLSYQREKTGPVLKADVTLALPIVKYLVPQAEFNTLPGKISEMMAELKAKQEEYGGALKVEGQLLHVDKDGAGDVDSFGAQLFAMLDLSKLPEGKPAVEEAYTFANIALEVSRKGLQASVALTINPLATAAIEAEKGAKQALAALIAQQPEAVAQLGQAVQQFDAAAGAILNQIGLKELLAAFGFGR